MLDNKLKNKVGKLGMLIQLAQMEYNEVVTLVALEETMQKKLAKQKKKGN